MSAAGQNPPSRNLFIAGFKSDMTDAALRALFSQYGSIESAKVMLDIHTGVSRGFAFVLFSDVEEAVKAREALNGSIQTLNDPKSTTIADQFKLTVEYAKHDAYNVVTRNVKVYCRNIPTNVDENAIAQLMHEWVGEGTVVTVAIMPDSNRSPAMFAPRAGGPPPANNKPTGNVAFIEFKTEADALRAVDLTYTKKIDGPGSVGPLMTKFAETAEVRSERKKRHPNAPPSPAITSSAPPSAAVTHSLTAAPPQMIGHGQFVAPGHMMPFAMPGMIPAGGMAVPPAAATFTPSPYFFSMVPHHQAGHIPMMPMMQQPPTGQFVLQPPAAVPPYESRAAWPSLNVQ